MNIMFNCHFASYQGQGALTYAGRLGLQQSTVIITQWKSHWTSISWGLRGIWHTQLALMNLAFGSTSVWYQNSAIQLQTEWVIYKYCTVHSILRWLPSRLAEYNSMDSWQLECRTTDSCQEGSQVESRKAQSDSSQWPRAKRRLGWGASQNVHHPSVGVRTLHWQAQGSLLPFWSGLPLAIAFEARILRYIYNMFNAMLHCYKACCIACYIACCASCYIA